VVNSLLITTKVNCSTSKFLLCWLISFKFLSTLFLDFWPWHFKWKKKHLNIKCTQCRAQIWNVLMYSRYNSSRTKTADHPFRDNFKSCCLRVHFFGRIQDWIFYPRSHRFITTKETKNPKMGYFCVTTPVKFSEKFTTSYEILGTFYDKIALKTHLDRSPCHPPDKTNWREYGRPYSKTACQT